MDLNHLLIFKNVVEQGSFSRAAHQLGQPKSSISQKIAFLEKELGARLLHRTTRRVSMTEIGERVYEVAARVALETEDITTFVKSIHEEPAGLLRVTAPHDLGIYMIHRHITDFRRLYPKIELELDLSNNYADLVAERFDVALRASESTLKDSTHVSRRLLPIYMKLFASPALLKSVADPLTPQGLEGYPMIWCNGAKRRQPFLWRLEHGEKHIEIPVRAAFRTNDFFAAKQAAIAGLGIALLPDLMCMSELAAGTLEEVAPAWSREAGQFYALYPSRNYVPTKTKTFVEFLATRLSHLKASFSQHLD